MRTLKATYSVSLDGGLAGTHLMRGSHAHEFEVYWLLSVIVIELFTGTFTDIDLGWASNTAAVVNVDATRLAVPVPGAAWWAVTGGTPLHFGAAEPFTATVNGGDAATGMLVLLLQADSP